MGADNHLTVIPNNYETSDETSENKKMTQELTRESKIVAREAITNLLINDWSAMDKEMLKKAEKELAENLGWEPEFSEE